MELHWRVADADVRSLVWGFVERRDPVPMGAASHFPVAYPHMQLSLAGGYSVDVGPVLAPIPRAALWGSSFEMRRAHPSGTLHAFVAAFTFEGAALLVRGSPSLAAGQILDLETLPACAGTGLVERLIEASGFERRVAIVQHFFRQLSAASAPGAISPILKLATAIATDACRGSVAGISEAFGVSERTLYNRLHLEIGCGPKRLLRLARLHRLLRSLHPSPFGGRPHVDPLLEFADQSHMHREFVELTGIRPSEFVSAKRRSGDRLFHSILAAPSPAGQG